MILQLVSATNNAPPSSAIKMSLHACTSKERYTEAISVRVSGGGSELQMLLNCVCLVQHCLAAANTVYVSV